MFEYWAYDATSWFVGQLMDVFFRDVAARNAHLVPETGPIIFVAGPHANQFVDAIVLLRKSPRRMFFIMAAVSMRRPIIGLLGKLAKAIPVERPQDLAIKGVGLVRIPDTVNRPTTVEGIDTKFTEQFEVGSTIALPGNKGAAEVVAIVSDTELTIKKEFKELEALALLTKPEGTAYKCVPHVDQARMYQAVHETLNRGECIGIFPEGGSHDRTSLLPLKAGAAIMALGAMAANPNINVKIVPVGMNYFHPHKFRSHAVADFGTPIEISPELVEKFKQGGPAKREACGALLKEIQEGLMSVTVNTSDVETLQLIQAGRRLYRPKGRTFSTGDVVELTRRFVRGYEMYKDVDEVKDIARRVSEYNKDLRYYGIRDHQVDSLQIGRRRAFAMLLYRVVLLLVMALFALPGVLLYSPVFITAKLISRKKAKEAVAGSTVKIEGRDVIGTWKILVGLVLTPLLYTSYAWIFVWILHRRPHLVLPWIVRLMEGRSILVQWLMTLTGHSVMSMLWLHLGDHGMDIYKSIRPLFLVLLLGHEQAKILNERRERLSNDITDLIEQLAPTLYPNFINTLRQNKSQSTATAATTSTAATDDKSDGGDIRRRRGQKPTSLPDVGAEDGGALSGGEGAASGSEYAAGVDGSEDGPQRPRRRFKLPPLTPSTLRKLDWVSPLDFLSSFAPIQALNPGQNNGSSSAAAAAAAAAADGVTGGDLESAASRYGLSSRRNFSGDDDNTGIFGSASLSNALGYSFDWEDATDIKKEDTDDVFFFRDENSDKVLGHNPSGHASRSASTATSRAGTPGRRRGASSASGDGNRPNLTSSQSFAALSSLSTFTALPPKAAQAQTNSALETFAETTNNNPKSA